MSKRPFDLNAAKAGAKLVTRDGREAKFIAYVPEAKEPLIVMTGRKVLTYLKDGLRYCYPESPHDLFLAVQTRSINGYEYPEPERFTPPFETLYWYPAITQESKVYTACWNGGTTDTRLLKRGLVHLTREAAEAHARAIILAGGGEV